MLNPAHNHRWLRRCYSIAGLEQGTALGNSKQFTQQETQLSPELGQTTPG